MLFWFWQTPANLTGRILGKDCRIGNVTYCRATICRTLWCGMLRDSFAGWEKSIARLWAPGKRRNWPQTGRQRSRRLEEPPNGLSGLKVRPCAAQPASAALAFQPTCCARRVLYNHRLSQILAKGSSLIFMKIILHLDFERAPVYPISTPCA